MIAEVVFYIAFYIIGVVLGSFFTLAIYRIPLKQDILYKRSYCPKCGNKLKSKDLIPILSYLFLKGKCRYCNEKISARYIIIEFFSGLFYLLFVLSLKIDIFSFNVIKIVQLIYGTLIISSFFIIGGIEKETKQLSTGTVIFGIIANIFYMIYLYILGNNIYRYIIYLIIIVTIYILGKILNTQRKIYDISILILFSIIATNEIIFIMSTIVTLFMCFISYFLHKKIINYMFYFSFLNILFIIVFNFVTIM